MYLKHGGGLVSKTNKEKVDSIWIDKQERLTEYLDDFQNCIYAEMELFSPWVENLKPLTGIKKII